MGNSWMLMGNSWMFMGNGLILMGPHGCSWENYVISLEIDGFDPAN